MLGQMLRGPGYLTVYGDVFALGCAMQGTATGLGIHRNTVLYRLKRIEELAGVDLADGDVRFFIQLALRAHRSLAS
jgi:DNA-binding PucR family transcriptional regulator